MLKTKAASAPTWLVLDCNFLCWRAAYVFPALTHMDKPTGVVYGFMKEVCHLVKAFNTGNLVMCFDAGQPLLRNNVLPGYKASRGVPDPACPNRRQIAELRDEILPQLGYLNVLSAPGYEADDLIARACTAATGTGGRAVVVSADKDLYQLLGPRVNLWNPITKKVTTAGEFVAHWGLPPARWAEVKAIAGCGSDDVRGVNGVAEKTAALYLKDPKRCPKRHRIEQHHDLIATNLVLTTLPYPGTPAVTLAEGGGPRPKEWVAFCKEFGFNSIRDEHPGRAF